ncbi:DUF418 domain-containing protein [Peptococcaceae bacterium]|nr:DUF418 domain-containing protein [Peptococcaceae bacterium]
MKSTDNNFVNNKLLPHRPSERIVELDVLRGFALFGLLLINILLFSSPLFYWLQAGIKEPWDGAIDKIVFIIIHTFVWTKFFVLFTVLFGIGFYIFMERAHKKRKRPSLLFFRRLIILLIIGLVHAFFIWFGDILVLYAIVGLLLPIFYKRRPKTIIVCVIILLLLSLIPTLLGYLVWSALPQDFRLEIMQEMIEESKLLAQNAMYAYSQGSFSDIMAQRITDVLIAYEMYLYYGLFYTLAMFLIGVYIAKKGILKDISGNISLIKKACVLSFIIGVLFSISKIFCFYAMSPLDIDIYYVLYTLSCIIGDTALGLFYASAIVLLMQKKWREKLLPLADVGRMALTNYIMQSVICTTIFYSYGLALYGKVGPAVCMIIAVAVFIVQLIFSRWWLKKWQYGPLEWVWRRLTYGKIA